MFLTESVSLLMFTDLEISDLVSESEVGLSFSRTPGQLLSLTSHLSFVSIQFPDINDFLKNKYYNKESLKRGL
jgi:hypothetical protein